MVPPTLLSTIYYFLPIKRPFGVVVDKLVTFAVNQDALGSVWVLLGNGFEVTEVVVHLCQGLVVCSCA